MEYQPVAIKNTLHVSAIPTLLYYSFTPDYVSGWDVHDFWELIYVDRGNTVIHAEDRAFALNNGQVILHRPNVRHRIRCDGVHEANVFIITFVCHSAAMKRFGNEPIGLPPSVRPLIVSLIEDGMRTFDCRKWLTPLPDAPLGGQQIIRLYLEILLIRLLRIAEQHDEPPRLPPSFSAESRLSEDIMAYLDEHIYEHVTIEQLCTVFHYRKSRLCALFKEHTGKTIISYFTEKKIETAKDLMRKGGSVGQIATALQFDTPQYFSRVFKSYTGLSPRAYRSSLMFDVNNHVKKRQLNAKRTQENERSTEKDS
ncbi:MAG: AraC family transcriptional regulator [Clostridia bacterium]|nr:AraC family transcriptional regulator [Clostridia bacterium]